MNTNKLLHSAPDGNNNNYCFTLRRRKKSATAYHPPPLIRNYEVYRWKGTSSTKGVRETVPNGYWGDSKYKPTQSQPNGNRETGHA